MLDELSKTVVAVVILIIRAYASKSGGSGIESGSGHFKVFKNVTVPTPRNIHLLEFIVKEYDWFVRSYFSVFRMVSEHRIPERDTLYVLTPTDSSSPYN